MNERSIFLEALEITAPAERAAFLDRACDGNAALRRGVEGLLAANDRSGTFMRPPAGGDVTVDRRPSEGPGSRVGPYKLLQEIGEGGMGTVFMAEQEEPVRRMVAVKIIRAGMDSKGVLARFEAERQALALMDHPNIAKVLDAGATDDGSPYFVMELVKGVPITRFCDENHLSLRERLELFVPVCQAIQHAHMKGVIHRDVKPSNVLVALYDDKPVPKVIDFGVAKATSQKLTDKTMFTAFGAVVGTLQYMSPEQAKLNQLDIDTRSDVYSLGVLLYELLTGSTPLDRARLKSAALDEVLRLIREEEPPKPSTRLSTAETLPQIAAARKSPAAQLGNALRGELDWIVMKALEKDRTRRYETANGFAADVQRYLTGEQVQAVPPSLGYRLRKAYRRNKGPVLAVGVVSLALLLGFAGTTTGMVWALGAERQAKADRDAAVKAEGEAAVNEVLARTQAANANAAREQQAADRYLSDMQLLPLAFEKGTVADVLRLLDRHVPAPGAADRRAFEWNYWDRQVNGHLHAERLAEEGEESVNSTWAVSPDGTRLARLSPPQRANGTEGILRRPSPELTVWDTKTRKVLLKHTLPIQVPEADQANFTFPAGHRPFFSPDGSRVEVGWSYRVDSTRMPPLVFRGGGGSGPIPPFVNRNPPVPQVRQVVDVAGKTQPVNLSGDSLFSDGGLFSRDSRRIAVLSWLTPGMVLTAGSRMQAVEIWDVELGKCLTAPAGRGPYWHVAFGGDGATFVTGDAVLPPDRQDALIAAAGGAGAIPAFRFSVRDAVSGKEQNGWTVAAGEVANLEVNPDGTLLAGTIYDFREAGPKSIDVWELPTGKLVSSYPLKGGVSGVARLLFNSNSKRLNVVRSTLRWTDAGMSYDLLTLNPRTGDPYSPLENVIVTSPQGCPVASPDGKWAIGFGSEGLQSWKVLTGRTHRTFRGHLSPVVGYGFSQDSEQVWSVDRNGVFKEWGLHPARPVEIPYATKFSSHQELLANMLSVGNFAVSGNGERFAQLAFTQSRQLAVQIRDLAGKELKLLPPSVREFGVRQISDVAVLASEQGLRLDQAGRRAVLTRGDELTVGFGAERPMPTLAPPDLTVWDTETGQTLVQKTFPGQEFLTGDSSGGHVVAVTPDGSTVAVGTKSTRADDTIRIRLCGVKDAPDAERTPLTLTGATGLLTLSFSPDGSRLAAVAYFEDEKLRVMTAKLVIWNPGGGEPVAQSTLISEVRLSTIGRAAMSRARICWSPDGTRMAVSHDCRLISMFTLRDGKTGEAVTTLELPKTATGTSPAVPVAVAYSPDGRRVAALVSTGWNTADRELKVWDTTTGREVLAVRRPSANSTQGGRMGGPPRDDCQLSFSGDGNRLIACEVGDTTEWTQEGELTSPAFIVTTWDATPVPNRTVR
jgi:serine/threonine protein kinase/WD40 repeat protein